MKARQLLFQPVGVGLLVAAAVAILLSHWFFAQARDELLADRQEREIIMQAMALADIVPALDQGDEEVLASRLQSLVTNWTATYSGISLIRVVRLSGARFLASTSANDSKQMPLPRRLQREEKWLYDLGQTLRAAIETNQQEGIFRKEQVVIKRIDHDLLRVSLPYLSNGKAAGLIQLEQHIEAPDLPKASALAILSIVLPVGLLLIGSYFTAFHRQADPAVSVSASKPWDLYIFAMVLFLAAVFSYGHYQLAATAELQIQYTDELAEHYRLIKSNLATVSDVDGPSVKGGVARLDVDHYQRPLGIIKDDGSVDARALQGGINGKRVLLIKSLLGNWVVGLLLLSFFALGYSRRLRETMVEHKSAYLYATPAILGMLVLVFFPFTYGIALSFTDQTLFNIALPITDIWIWFNNYIQILGDFNVAQSTPEGWIINYQNFYWTLFITIAWTICNVSIGVSVGMLLALALNTKGLRYKSVYRVLLILPWAIPNYITALIWKGMFHQQFGVINQAIQMFGGEPIAWFDGVFTSFLTGIATNGWLSFPFMMVIILGALQSIPADMYEAARVEGTTRWQQFRYITLPLLKPTLIPAIIISVVWTFNMFNIIYLVSEGQPAGANEILITEAYKIAFEKYQYGYAAAYSVVVFMILLVYGVFQTRMTKATEAAA